MTQYKVHGPFKIPVLKRRAGREIGDPKLFWTKISENDYNLNKSSGIYIYAIKTGRGITPQYVGRATKNFEQECFHPHKMVKYTKALVNYLKGRPVMYFIIRPKKRGKVNTTQIKRIEEFIIQLAYARDIGIQNINGIKLPQWSIEGIINIPKGNLQNQLFLLKK